MATIRDYLQNHAKILSNSGPNVFIECPGCHTRKAKCSVHVGRGVGNCFRAKCSLNGGFNFLRLIEVLQGVGFSEALRIASGYQDEVTWEYKARSWGTNGLYPAGSLPLQEALNKAQPGGVLKDKALFYMAMHAAEYLVEKRNLTLQQIEAYQIGIGFEDQQDVPRVGMLIIPILFNETLVSYVSRSVEYQRNLLGRQKHYLPKAAEGYMLAGEILFNCDKAIPTAKRAGYLPIVEDVWSAMKLDAVATMGSNLSADQLFVLANNYRGPVCVCRDNDPGGRKAAARDIRLLSRHYGDVRDVIPVGVDPDDDVVATRRALQSSAPMDLFQHNLRLSLKR